MNFPWKKKSVTERLRAVQESSPVPASPEVPLVSAQAPLPIANSAMESAAPEVTDDTAIQKERYLRDPLAFATEILGLQLSEEHRGLLQLYLDESAHNILSLWARGSGKSTCLRVAVVLSILKNPDIRILWASSDEDVIVRQFEKVRDVFKRPTAAFKHLWPEFCEVRGRANEFTIACRRDQTSSTEPTFSVTPLGADATGSHWDLIVIDDLVTKKNSATKDQCERTFERYTSFRALRAANTRIIVSGTPYNEWDSYEKIIRIAQAEGKASTWRIDRRGATEYKCKNCGCKYVFHFAGRCRICNDTHPFEPGEKCVLIDRVETPSGAFGFTLEQLESERLNLGDKFYLAQYEMRVAPEAASSVTFSPGFLNQHTSAQDMSNFQPHFIVCDPAWGTSNRANPSVIMAVIVLNGTLYPLACIAGKWEGKQLEDALFDFIDHYRCPVFVEESPQFASLRDNLPKRVRTVRNLQIKSIPLTREKDAKRTRIAGLYDAMLKSKVGLYSRMLKHGELVQQLGKFAHLSEDDYADTLSLALWVAENDPPPGMPAVVEREPIIVSAPPPPPLNCAEQAIAEAAPVRGSRIVWIDKLSEDRREHLQLTAETYDTIFLTNNQECARMAWNSQQPALAVDQWFEEWSRHSAIAAARKIWVVLPAGNQEQNRRFLESLAQSSIQAKCAVITQPEIPGMFSYRMQMQRASRLTADSVFEKAYPCESIEDALARVIAEAAHPVNVAQPVVTVPVGVTVPARRKPDDPDIEPSAAGDPIGYSRYLRRQEERREIEESAGGLATG